MYYYSYNVEKIIPEENYSYEESQKYYLVEDFSSCYGKIKIMEYDVKHLRAKATKKLTHMQAAILLYNIAKYNKWSNDYTIIKILTNALKEATFESVLAKLESIQNEEEMIEYFEKNYITKEK